MEPSLQLEIVTPDKVVVSQPVDYIGVPGVEGEFGILPHHVPLLSALAIGHLYFRVGDKTRMCSSPGGFAEVSGNTITVLAESANWPKTSTQPALGPLWNGLRLAWPLLRTMWTWFVLSLLCSGRSHD